VVLNRHTLSNFETRDTWLASCFDHFTLRHLLGKRLRGTKILPLARNWRPLRQTLYRLSYRQGSVVCNVRERFLLSEVVYTSELGFGHSLELKAGMTTHPTMSASRLRYTCMSKHRFYSTRCSSYIKILNLPTTKNVCFSAGHMVPDPLFSLTDDRSRRDTLF